jgi:hypothetical protein
MTGRDPLNTISEVDAICNLVLSVEIHLLLLLTNEAISCGFQESIKKKADSLKYFSIEKFNQYYMLQFLKYLTLLDCTSENIER